ncbi:MAG TPA: cation:proton antiporter [Gemmata sp.]
MGEPTLLCLAGILVAGAVAQWAAWRLRVPAILMLLGTGLAAGPGLRLLNPDQLFGELLLPGISLGVAVILFEGGLGLRFRELRGVRGALLRLLTIGVAVTWLGAAGAARWVLGFDWPLAFVLGAVLTVTGPTVVGPLLRDIRMNGRVGALLRWEGIVVDPIGALLAAVVVLLIRSGTHSVSTGHILGDLATVVGVGTALGLLAAALLVLVMRRYWAPDRLHSPLTLAAVIGAFALADQLCNDAGLVAVTVMGIAMANQRVVAVKHVLEFKETLVVILLSALFIVLGARIRPATVLELGGPGLVFVGLLVFVVRPLSVLCSTARSGLTWPERGFIAGLAPRGVVAAAVASVFGLELVGAGVVGAERLLPVTVLTVLVTVTFYALAAPALARRLKLVHPNPQGVLFVGAAEWVRRLAKALSDAGAVVTLVDTDWTNIRAARMMGLTTVYGSILSERVLEDIDTSKLRRLIAATPNDELNALACQRFVEVFGRDEVYHLPAGRETGRLVTVAPEQRGREFLGPECTFTEVARRAGAAVEVRATTLSAEFGFAQWTERNGSAALPLVLVRSDRTIALFTASALRPVAGDTVIALTVRGSAPPG